MTKRCREDLESLMAELAPHLRRAGVSETQINIAKGPNYKVHHYVKAYDWLHDFKLSDEYAEYDRVWAMRPPEVWLNYEMLGVEGLQEQVLLQEAGAVLIKRWRVKRPRMFGPDREVPEDEQNDGSERVEDQGGVS